MDQLDREAPCTPPPSRRAGLDSLHRMMTGQTLTRKELILGGSFIVLWFVMDLVQWLDWLFEKIGKQDACQPRP